MSFLTMQTLKVFPLLHYSVMMTVNYIHFNHLHRKPTKDKVWSQSEQTCSLILWVFLIQSVSKDRGSCIMSPLVFLSLMSLHFNPVLPHTFLPDINAPPLQSNICSDNKPSISAETIFFLDSLRTMAALQMRMFIYGHQYLIEFTLILR